MKETYLAQTELGTLGGENGFGPFGGLGKFYDVRTAAGHFTHIISTIIGIMTVIAGIWFFFLLIIGAFGFLTAGGDPKKIESATRRIGNALTGLIIIVLAYALISLIGRILGIHILDPQDIIMELQP